MRVPQADRALRVLPDEVSRRGGRLPRRHPPDRATARSCAAASRPADTVVVVGCGPVGLMAILCAVGAAGRVLAVDGVAARRELAERLGAEPVEPERAADAVAEATGGLA